MPECTGGLARKLAAMAAGKPLVDPPAISIPPSALAEYAGVYLFEGDVKIVVAAGESLTVQPTGGAAPSKLFPMGPDRFFVRDSFSRFAFERDAAGKVTGVTRTSWNAVDKGRRSEEPAPKARQEIKIAPAVFDAYVGEYQLAPGFSITVTREGERFMTQATGQQKVEIQLGIERRNLGRDPHHLRRVLNQTSATRMMIFPRRGGASETVAEFFYERLGQSPQAGIAD
jgi:hypothetical protein